MASVRALATRRERRSAARSQLPAVAVPRPAVQCSVRRAIRYPYFVPTTGNDRVVTPEQVGDMSHEKVQFSVDTQGRRRIHPNALDGSNRAHNPKVAGSNPAPATKTKALVRRGFPGRGFLLSGVGI